MPPRCEIEAASLELVGAAHRFDGAEQDQLAVGRLDDLQVAADGDVHVAERGAGRAARPKPLATQHQVVGNREAQVELDRRERAGRRRQVPASAGLWCRARRAWFRRAAARLAVASSALPPLSTVPLGGNHRRQLLDRIRVVEQLQDPIDFEAGRFEPDRAADLRPAQLAGDRQRRCRRRRRRARCRSPRSCRARCQIRRRRPAARAPRARRRRSAAPLPRRRSANFCRWILSGSSSIRVSRPV